MLVELVYLASRLGVPLAEVAVNWAEVPGSKIRITSIAHMALELAAIAVGYGTGVWRGWGRAGGDVFFFFFFSIAVAERERDVLKPKERSPRRVS